MRTDATTDLGDHDVLVVGGGIAGVSLAGELAAEASVLLLEREEAPAYHASGRSAAVSVPALSTDAVYAMTRVTTPFLLDPPADFAEHALATGRGFLVVAAPDECEALDAMLADWGGRCPELHEIDEAEARRRVPVLRPGASVRFALDPSIHALDTHGMIQGWLRRLRAGGGSVVTGAEVRSVERRDGRFVVETAAGTARAPVVVNAAGAWASSLARLAGASPIELVPHRRSAALIAPPGDVDVADWPMVITATDRFYFKPEGRALMLSPADATPTEPVDARPEEIDLAIAVDRAEQVADLGVRRFEATWAGLRTFAPDRLPVFGHDPVLPGFYWCAGQGGAGFQTALGAARWCAADLGVGAVPDGLREHGFRARDVDPSRLT